MTVIRPNSISGITSLTAHRGSIDFYAHDGSAARFDNINSNVTSGVSTFASLNITGDLDVGGALTYEDVTNIDSVGVITARAGVKLPDNQKVFLGTSDDLWIYHDGGNSWVRDVGTGTLYIDSNGSGVIFSKNTATEKTAAFYTDGAVELYYDNSKKFETTSGGVEVSSGNLTMQSNGRIFVGNGGNAVNPMFANVSDTNTGIAFPAADTMMFTTGGTERFRITSSGVINCGHGDAINLHSSTTTGINLNGNGNSGQIVANASGNRALIIGRQANYGQVIEFFQGTNANDAAITIPAADSFGIETAGTERLRITSTGKVGINETSPTAPLSIKVGSGGEYVQDFSGSSTKQFGFFYDQNNWNAATFRIDEFDNNGTATSRLTITDGGKVGVGCDAEVDFQVRNGNGGILKVGGSGNSATGFQIQYNNSGNTTTEILTNYRATSSNASLKLDTGTLKIATGTSGTDQLIIDSSGRILKGMSASLLGSSDVQLAGSGSPAKIAGYWSNNNPNANNSMLTVTGYSQSGSTFTGIGEIDFRVEQSSNTASGYHPGSIVTRVNGGSTTGTHAGTAYSYAGLKDRERITFKSKRYYSLPEWASGSDTYNTFREEWDYQHYVGFNRYSWYRFTSHSSSSSRGGSVDIRVTWSTRHAAGNGYGHYAFHWRDNHGTGYMDIGNVYRYHQNHLSGSYYGWSSSPQLDVYEINDNGNVAGFYLRVQGHIDANSSTYDGGVMHQFLISAHTNRYGADVNKFEFVGNSTPSDVGSIQGNNNLP